MTNIVTFELHRHQCAPVDLEERGYQSTPQMCARLGLSQTGFEYYRRVGSWPGNAIERRAGRTYFHQETVYAFFRALPLSISVPIPPVWLETVGHPMAAAIRSRKPSRKQARG